MKNARLASALTLFILTGASAFAGGNPGGLQTIQPASNHEGIDNVMQQLQEQGLRSLALEPVVICTVPNPYAGVEDYSAPGLHTPAPWLPYRAGLFVSGPYTIASVPSRRGVIMNIGLPSQCPN